jgi:hypothetical protein
MTTEKPAPMSDFASSFGIDESPSPSRVALHRLANGLRSLTESMAGTKAPQDELEKAAGFVEALAAHVASFGSNARHFGAAESALGDLGQGDDARFYFRDHSPVAGIGNPIAPPLDLHAEGDHVVGSCTYGRPYEGPPGHVHGGWIAAVFDELLGMAQALTGSPGMTAKLTINYRKPTPLYLPIRYIGRVDRIEGRKIFTVAQAYRTDTDELLDEAEGLFISMSLQNIMDPAELVWSKAANQTPPAKG